MSDESYSVLIFSVGTNPTEEPKPSFEPSTKEAETETEAETVETEVDADTVDTTDADEKKVYVPSPYENWFTNDKPKGIPFDDLHRTIEDGPITLNMNGLGAAGKELYDAMSKSEKVSNHIMEFMAVDSVNGLHQGRYRYDSTLCVMIELIRGDTMPGSKCDHFRRYSVFGESEHEFQLIRMNSSVSERDQRILRSVAAKRTAISEYFGKFELFFSENKKVDFTKFTLNEVGFKAEDQDTLITRDNLIRQTTLNRSELYCNLEIEFEDLTGFEFEDEFTRAGWESDFMVVVSTHHYHLGQIVKSLEFALKALNYEYELIDV
jgi:hypothetical protein